MKKRWGRKRPKVKHIGLERGESCTRCASIKGVGKGLCKKTPAGAGEDLAGAGMRKRKKKKLGGGRE